MIIDNEEHRGYKPHIEHGTITWYRTTASSTFAKNMTTGKEQKTGTRMDRVVTNATDLEEAKKQLDRRLSRPKEPKTDLSGNYKMDF